MFILQLNISAPKRQLDQNRSFFDAQTSTLLFFHWKKNSHKIRGHENPEDILIKQIKWLGNQHDIFKICVYNYLDYLCQLLYLEENALIYTWQTIKFSINEQ